MGGLRTCFWAVNFLYLHVTVYRGKTGVQVAIALRDTLKVKVF